MMRSNQLRKLGLPLQKSNQQEILGFNQSQAEEGFLRTSFLFLRHNDNSVNAQ
jgi:hypothetical protein